MREARVCDGLLAVNRIKYSLACVCEAEGIWRVRLEVSVSATGRLCLLLSLLRDDFLFARSIQVDVSSLLLQGTCEGQICCLLPFPSQAQTKEDAANAVAESAAWSLRHTVFHDGGVLHAPRAVQ